MLNKGKGGGSRFLNFPKCVFLALKTNFSAKIDKESPKCAEGGALVQEKIL